MTLAPRRRPLRISPSCEISNWKKESVKTTQSALIELLIKHWERSFTSCFRTLSNTAVLDRQNSIVRGLRYVRLKKHIATNRADFLHRAEGYPELQAYLSTRVPAQGSFKFYEIAIGDQGLGIIGRFLSTRPDFNNPTTSSERASLVNQIIDQALSSKRGRSGAGYGLRNALRAVRELDGFLSLRTDALWLHWSPSASEALRLTPVSGMSELAHVQGTHFSMLFPFAFARHL